MENNEVYVEIIADKTYFKEDNLNIFIKFNKKNMKPKSSDWIALYKCSSNRNLEEFVAVETTLVIRSPTKTGLIPVQFYDKQLKNVKCNEEYEFLYGNKYNEICGISHPVRFFHKNDCFCYPNVFEINRCNDCVSQELVNSLLARISLVDKQLNDCKILSNEILSMNKDLTTQLNKCEATVQKNNQLLENLFYTNEPVTKNGFQWMQPCTDFDIKKDLMAGQECELQDLSNQNAGLKKLLEKFNKNTKVKWITKGTQTEESYLLVNLVKKKDVTKFSNTDPDKLLDSVVNVESGFIPEPSSASFVYIDSDGDDV